MLPSATGLADSANTASLRLGRMDVCVSRGSQPRCNGEPPEGATFSTGSLVPRVVRAGPRRHQAQEAQAARVWKDPEHPGGPGGRPQEGVPVNCQTPAASGEEALSMVTLIVYFSGQGLVLSPCPS